MLRKLTMLALLLPAVPLAFAAGAEGPVPDSLPPPVESEPPDGRLRDELSERMRGDYDVRKRHAGETPWLRNRLSRCFFGPIKRPPFHRDELADDVDYYPENYLDRLAREGVNGLWLTIEFKDFSRELTGDWPEGAERRLAKLRRTVEKCSRHGIRIWLFCIEPIEQDFRRSPLALKHPDWIGCTYDDLMGTMCASHPGVQKYIADTVRDIFTAVPGLGGVINISNGEMVTSCLSIVELENHPCRTLCPRCRDVPPEELLQRVNRAFVKGIREAGSNAEFISWIYKSAPDTSLPDWVRAAAATSPDGIIQQVNFETGVVVEQEGRAHVGGDYWLSQPGPSLSFSRVAEAARASSKRLSAKIQVSCSHELATIPVLPVPGLLYRKFKGMREQGVTDAMYCWYFGSAPGLMNKAAGELAYVDFKKEDEQAFLLRLAADDWGADAETVARIWKACSDGFAHYPVSNHVQYYGPFHQGVAWPLRADIEMRPLGASWLPNQPAAGDMIGECLADFDLREVLSLSEKMCAEVRSIEPDLAGLERKFAGDDERMLDLGLIRAFLCHLEAARDVFEFYYQRREAVMSSRSGDKDTALRALSRMKAIAAREKVVTDTMRRLCERDSRLGFHSEAESHLYTPAYFDWRRATLKATEARLETIIGEVRAGNGYPLSDLEKKAPTFPARLDACGNLIVEGEAKGRGDVTVWLLDACGTQYQKSYVVAPKGGRFSLTIPSRDWNDDPRLRPYWIQIHQGCHYLGDSWQWPPLPKVEWRFHHGDVLGYLSARIDYGKSPLSDGAVNVALGKRYAFTRPPNDSSCPDSPVTPRLTDGRYVDGPGTIWTHPGTVGWQNGSDFTVGIKVDLGKVENLSGFSLNFAAGAAGVAWPQLVNVYVSDDGVSWNFVDDVYARSRRENGAPAMDGYAVYRAHSESMPAKGRYVAFYVRTRGYCFCDEIEVYGGPEPKNWNPVTIGSPEGHLESYVLRNRLESELERLVKRGEAFPRTGRVRFDAEVARLRESIADLVRKPFDIRQRTVVPINSVHREILKLNTLFLRKAGIRRPMLWVCDRWENLDPLAIPDADGLAETPLEVEMMRGETRATAFNVANPTSDELDCSVEVTGLPATANVDCREVVFTDTKTGECVSGALRPDERGVLSFRIPSGVSKQVWISFAKPTGGAGVFRGKAVVTLSGGTVLEREFVLCLHDLDFPKRPTLHVHGWDYTFGNSDYYRAPGNLASNLRTLREIFTDMPWADPPVLPQGAKFDAEGNLINADSLDCRWWDEWIARWSDARMHAVFLVADGGKKDGKFRYQGEPVGTPRFYRMVESYFRMLYGRYRRAALPDARLLVMPVDEPGGNWFPDNGEIVRLIADWAKALKSAVPEIIIFENPIYRNPTDGDGMFSLVDVICPSAGHFVDPQNGALRDYYLRQRAAGKELWLYSCSGPSRTLDPETYYRSMGWLNYQLGGRGMGFWAFGCGGGIGDSWHAYAQSGTEYSPYFVSPTETMSAKQSEGIREGVEDYEYLRMLETAVAVAEKSGLETAKAKAVLETAPMRALGQGARFERPDSIKWNAAKKRGCMDSARIEVLRALADIARRARRKVGADHFPTTICDRGGLDRE